MMLDISTTVAAATAAIIWFGVIVAAYMKLNRFRKRKLLRCPEVGAITLVDVEENALSGHLFDQAPRLKVKHCRLWPEKADCSRGCLIRCDQPCEGYGFDLSSLRPFENRELRQHISSAHSRGDSENLVWKSFPAL